MSDCTHAKLQFNSGDYYISCVGCQATWMLRARDGRPEYGLDGDGKRVGAAPDEANKGPPPAPGFRAVVGRGQEP